MFSGRHTDSDEMYADIGGYRVDMIETFCNNCILDLLLQFTFIKLFGSTGTANCSENSSLDFSPTDFL